MPQIKLYFLYIWIFIFIPLFHLKAQQMINEDSRKSLDCPNALQDRPIELDQMVSQIKGILDKIEITETNRGIVQMSYSAILRWTRGSKDFRMKTLLQIFYFLGIPPSIALTSNDLESYVDFEELRSKSYPPEANIQQLLILINRHLRKQIEEFQLEFAIDSGLKESKFTLLELGEIMQGSRKTLNKIRNSNAVPNYSIMKRILEIGTSIEFFFEEVESFEEFNILFNNNHLKVTFEEKQIATQEERQIVEDRINRLMELMFQRGARGIKHVRKLIGFNKNAKPLDQLRPSITLFIKASYVTRYPLSYFFTDNDNLNNNIDLPDIRTDKGVHRQEYIRKAKKVLFYLIKSEIIYKGLSLQQFAINSNLSMSYLRYFFEREKGVGLSYLTLLNMVEKGLGIKLENFLQGENSIQLNFEQLIDQFDTIDFNNIGVISSKYTGIVNIYMEYLDNRLPRILESLKMNITDSQRDKLIGINKNINKERENSLV